MANKERDTTPNGAPVLVRQPDLPGQGGFSDTSIRVVLAAVFSGVVHAVMLLAFVFVTWTASAADVPTETAIIESKVEDDQPVEANLTNEDIGMNAELPTNYNVDRLADVSVPGRVDVNASIGLENAPQAAAMTIPPPPGIGSGQGGGHDASIFGKGSTIGAVGGYGGMQLSPGGFGGRSGATREKMLEEGGGNGESEATVARGLKWIALHQANDGHWALDGFHQTAKDKITAGGRQFTCTCGGRGTKNDIAGTAFGLLPLLAAGETHKPPTNKNTEHYTKQVDLGLKYLMSRQNREGDFGGGLYAHGLAAIAMCEAYGLTSDPALKSSAQRAIDFIVKAQHSGGGWRYVPNQAGDTSVVGWQVMALKSGQMAGLNVPKSTLDSTGKFLDSVGTSDGGKYGYQGPQETPTLSAVGLLCRQYLGWTQRNPGLLNGVAYLNRTPPGRLDSMYYYYYATQVMHHMGGDSWKLWNAGVDKDGKKVHTGMRDLLVKQQDKGDNIQKAHQKGSWDPGRDAHGNVGGRLMITSLSTLTLEVYYRHLPLYRRDMGAMKEQQP